MSFNYKNLKLKIKEVYDNEPQVAFAKAMQMSYTALNQRLNNTVKWKTPEIVRACNLLGIPLSEAYKYFFIPEV